MNLIKLTEYKHSKSENGTKTVEEVPVLINPEGIESVVTTKLENESTIPIIGETENERPMSGLMMRSGRKHAIKETLDEIAEILSQVLSVQQVALVPLPGPEIAPQLPAEFSGTALDIAKELGQ